MIEVLVHGDLMLPDDTSVRCYHPGDDGLAQEILTGVGSPWGSEAVGTGCSYNRREDYVRNVAEFIAHALADPNWRGTILEFDNV
jgi:hypothetical protein